MINLNWFLTCLLAKIAGHVIGIHIERSLFKDEGSCVSLSCSCTNETKITWIGPNRSYNSTENGQDDIPYSEGSDINPHLNVTNIKVIHNISLGKCYLEILNFSTIDEGTYTCQTFQSKMFKPYIFNVFLKKLPSNLLMTTANTNQSITIIEGRNSSLMCQVRSGKPKEELKLIVKDIIKAKGSGCVIYSFIPQKTDHNASVRCEALSEIMKSPLVTERRLDVHFIPTVVLTLKPKQMIEGRNATLCCKVESNPHSNISWIGDKTERRRLTQAVLKCLDWPFIHRTQDGAYTCIAENYLGSVNATIDIKVYYTPHVIVAYNLTNGTLNIQCNPSGVPNNYTFLQLEHRSEFNEHIRFLNFSNDGYVLHTSIEYAGIQDTGIYVCNVSNGIPDKNGKSFQSQKTLFELEDTPVFLDGDIIRYAKFGEVIDISVVVYNRHNVTEAEIHSITTNQSKRNITHQIKINRSFVRVRKMYHGSNLTLNASQVAFQLDRMTEKNFAKYILKVCNKYGCTNIKIDIIIDTFKNQGSARSKYQDVEIVFAALAVLSVLGIGMGVAYSIWKRVTDKDKSTLGQTEDIGEDIQGQSVENRLYQSKEIVNSDNPAHILHEQANVDHAIASSSQAEPTRNDQSYISGSQLNYSEIVFEAGPLSNSNIIHCANDKTNYSEIYLATIVRFNNDDSDTNSEEDFINIDGNINPEKK